MAAPQESVVRLPDGFIGLRLVPRERAILRALIEDLRAVVGEESTPPGMRDLDVGADPAADADAGADAELPVDAVRRRLNPDSRPDDPAASERFRDMVRRDLDDGRRRNLSVVEATLEERTIDDAQADAWLHVLNDLRLVMGTRLGVTQGHEGDDFDPEAPDAPAKIVYAYTGWLEGQFVDVLAAALPPVPGDDGDPDEGVADDDS
ncbi:MAG TPA: DUF2017 family protein [Candidatus Limnocylindrales bacterium]|nr:DUF2017 family protein [Candidatus Limnocylindrales bacterium]